MHRKFRCAHCGVVEDVPLVRWPIRASNWWCHNCSVEYAAERRNDAWPLARSMLVSAGVTGVAVGVGASLGLIFPALLIGGAITFFGTYIVSTERTMGRAARAAHPELPRAKAHERDED